MKVSRSARALCAALCAVTALLVSPGADAVRISNVRNSKHNLSATSSTATRTVTAVSETQICAFCHTPHGATMTAVGGAAITGQLWNRTVPNSTTYTGYTSSSLDAATIQAGFSGQPAGSSKLCLSCHDGTLALGSVNVLNGASPPVPIAMTGGITTLPTGTYGATSGFTENLGANLTNDHPISVTYDNTLATRDGELRGLDANQKYPATTGTVIGKRTAGYKPLLPLEPTGSGATGQIQCSACHDPHIVETDTTKGNQKFLRTNRFQEAKPTATYSQTNDIICLSCHDKNGTAGVWAYSAHANDAVAAETYTAAAVVPREFPANLPVWKAACLNCHDSHTVQGARRLLREGTNGALASGVRQGGSPALENTCYQCHTSAAASIVTPTTGMKDIQTDFGLLRKMPVATATEVHDVGGNFNDATFNDCTTTTNKCGADGIEQRSKLGFGALGNRHVECSDCHNPHRVVKFQKFYGAAGSLSGAPDASATHTHTAVAPTVAHDNIASGALRGTWGVEPTYTNASFQVLPSGYIVKRGDPAANASTVVTQPYVTREYQVCLKCHSNYAYNDSNVNATGGSSSGRPPLGYAGGTPSNTNLVTYYTNQAKEFQAPTAHRGTVLNLGTAAGAGSGANWNTNNYRSWHPVMGSTGRTNGTLTIPWNSFKGTQTMYCSDCHGTNVTSTTSVIPNTGGNWGPHGSTNNFVLKGVWSPTDTTSASSVTTGLCLKCHAAATYQSTSNTGSGWANFGHGSHYNFLGNKLRCNWCHVAVPHGWKNKSLLVNLSDVGPEVGATAGTVISTFPYNNGPYYVNAYLKVLGNFLAAGSWNNKSQCNHGHADPP